MPDDDRPDLRDALAGSETPAGTAAFLQALMSVLGDVLERVDNRLASLEAWAVPARQGPPPATEDMVDTVLATLGGLSERLEGLEARDPPEAVVERMTPRLEELTAAVTGLGRDVAELRQDAAVPPAAELQEAVRRLEEQFNGLTAELRDQMASQAAVVPRLDDLSGAVDSIGYGLAGMADLITATSPGEGEWPEELRAAVAALAEGVGELRHEAQAVPVAELQEAVKRLEVQLDSVAAQVAMQPGPGPALAMVAAGLAERFEERTQALTDLLATHAAYVRQTWERIEGALDGGSFDELAVGEALEHVIDNQERMVDSVQQVLAGLEEIRRMPGSPGEALLEDALARDTQAHEALASLGAGMEGIGARVDDVRRRLATLAATLEASNQGQGRSESAGRRLASDLGLRGRGRPQRPPDGDPT